MKWHRSIRTRRAERRAFCSKAVSGSPTKFLPPFVVVVLREIKERREEGRKGGREGRRRKGDLLFY